MKKETILITGAGGQIGTVLTDELVKKHGQSNVIATDIRALPDTKGTFEQLNILDAERLQSLVQTYQVTQIYHLAAILSAKGEANPLKTWEINMNGLFNVLNTAKDYQVGKLFYPSSIAVFGTTTPLQDTPQHTVTEPSTVYGMSKIAGENWCQYYFQKYGVDVRSVRYPGIIGYQSLPGGGTTDYAVEIYHKAIDKGSYTCFLKAHTKLPMMYMEDAIRATISIMEAPKNQIKVRTSYNVSSMSFSPAEVAEAIQQHIPSFKISYEPDFRQAIAESWTASMDDSAAQQDWGWKTKYNLESMTKDMIFQLSVIRKKITNE